MQRFRLLSGLRWATVLFLVAVCGRAQINLTSPSSEWVPLSYGNSNFPDPIADVQAGAGSNADLVGTNGIPSFYTRFDNAGTADLTDGYLAFRIRLATANSKGEFSRVVFIGLSVQTNGVFDGKLHLFIGVDNQGANRISLYDPGTGLNTSPSTTTIGSPLVSWLEGGSNYNFSACSTIDPPGTNLGGTPNYFLSFIVPFNAVVQQLAARGIPFDENSALMYVMGTSTQGSNINSDLNGVNGGIGSGKSWASLGAMTEIYSAGGIYLVPEPNSAALTLAGMAIAVLHLRRRKSIRH